MTVINFWLATLQTSISISNIFASNILSFYFQTVRRICRDVMALLQMNQSSYPAKYPNWSMHCCDHVLIRRVYWLLTAKTCGAKIRSSLWAQWNLEFFNMVVCVSGAWNLNLNQNAHVETHTYIIYIYIYITLSVSLHQQRRANHIDTVPLAWVST